MFVRKQPHLLQPHMIRSSPGVRGSQISVPRFLDVRVGARVEWHHQKVQKLQNQPMRHTSVSKTMEQRLISASSSRQQTRCCARMGNLLTSETPGQAQTSNRTAILDLNPDFRASWTSGSEGMARHGGGGRSTANP